MIFVVCCGDAAVVAFTDVRQNYGEGRVDMHFHIADHIGKHKTLSFGMLYAVAIAVVLAVAARL